MHTIKIGIQPLAELREEMRAVARGERKADPEAPKVRFQSLAALPTALKTDVATIQRVLLPAPATDDDHDDDDDDYLLDETEDPPAGTGANGLV